MTDSTKIKILEYSVAIVFFIVLVTVLADIPPGSFFISIYCKVFQTDKYFPIMLSLFVTLIYAIPVFYIKKRILEKNAK